MRRWRYDGPFARVSTPLNTIAERGDIIELPEHITMNAMWTEVGADGAVEAVAVNENTQADEGADYGNP